MTPKCRRLLVVIPLAPLVLFLVLIVAAGDTAEKACRWINSKLPRPR